VKIQYLVFYKPAKLAILNQALSLQALIMYAFVSQILSVI